MEWGISPAKGGREGGREDEQSVYIILITWVSVKYDELFHEYSICIFHEPKVSINTD